MTVILALAAALTWGTNELVLSRGARQLHPLVLALWLMILGALVIVPIAVWRDPLPGMADIPYMVGPSLIALAGTLTYFIALRDGMLSIVSPTVATSGGISAVIAIVAVGERFSAVSLLAMALAVVGVVLATFAGGGGKAKGVVWAVVAAFLLGLYNVTLAASADRIGPFWAVASYRLTGLLVLAPVVLVIRVPVKPDRPRARMLVIAVALETAGFIALSLALERGPVAVASVIMAQFATVAVLLAAVVLHERLLLHQWVGVVLMIVSITVLAALQ